MAEEGNLGGLELRFKKKKKNEKLRGAMPHPVCPWPTVKVRLGPGKPRRLEVSVPSPLSQGVF